MSISILVEPTVNGFRANTGGPLDLTADGATTHDAIEALRAKIAARFQYGARIVNLPMPPAPPIPTLPLAANPMFEDFLKAVEDYRNKCDVEDQALKSYFVP